MHQPGLPQALQRVVGLAGFHFAAELDEVGQGALAQWQHAQLHGQVAVEVAQPADAGAFEVAPERRGQAVRVVAQRQRRARVIAGLGV
ncbi:hypothetical protein D3C78_1683540 [compost metagenome]